MIIENSSIPHFLQAESRALVEARIGKKVEEWNLKTRAESRALVEAHIGKRFEEWDNETRAEFERDLQEFFSRPFSSLPDAASGAPLLPEGEALPDAEAQLTAYRKLGQKAQRELVEGRYRAARNTFEKLLKAVDSGTKAALERTGLRDLHKRKFRSKIDLSPAAELAQEFVARKLIPEPLTVAGIKRWRDAAVTSERNDYGEDWFREPRYYFLNVLSEPEAKRALLDGFKSHANQLEKRERIAKDKRQRHDDRVKKTKVTRARARLREQGVTGTITERDISKELMTQCQPWAEKRHSKSL